MSIFDRFTHAWNAFRNPNAAISPKSIGAGNSRPPFGNTRLYAEASLADQVFNKIAVDVSMVEIRHVKVDANDDTKQTPVDSNLQRCLSEEANIDQTGIALIHDIVYSMFDEGVVAVGPVIATGNILTTQSYDVTSMRAGRITQWYPQHVRVLLYDEQDGQKKELTLPKSGVAIIQNPFYNVVNGNNALMRRIKMKMAQLDSVDAKAASGKLDLLFQVPYVTRGKTLKKRAEDRRAELENQLENGKYGVAWIDGAEKVTQLNRPVTNTLQDEITQLTTQFFNALGLTENVMNGTAGEQEMLAYYTRTIDPVMRSILSEMQRKFITKTGYTQGQRLMAYRNPFALVPVEKIAEMADTFRRDEILESNEIRGLIGFRPSSDPKANQLANPNVADTNQATAKPSTSVGLGSTTDTSGQ